MISYLANFSLPLGCYGFSDLFAFGWVVQGGFWKLDFFTGQIGFSYVNTISCGSKENFTGQNQRILTYDVYYDCFAIFRFTFYFFLFVFWFFVLLCFFVYLSFDFSCCFFFVVVLVVYHMDIVPYHDIYVVSVFPPMVIHYQL